MHLMSYRNLGQEGGRLFDNRILQSERQPLRQVDRQGLQVLNIDPDNKDAISKRQATPADAFVSPFPNDDAAKASNGGALPPDLSLIVKARDDGPQYVYSILTGYAPTPAGMTVPANSSYEQPRRASLPT